MENNMNEQQEIKEVTIFGKIYKIENLTNRVVGTFVAVQRLQKEAEEANYQSVKVSSACEFQQTALKNMIEEDKIQSESKAEQPKEEDPVEDSES